MFIGFCRIFATEPRPKIGPYLEEVVARMTHSKTALSTISDCNPQTIVSKTTVDLNTQSGVAVLKGNCVKFGFAVLMSVQQIAEILQQTSRTAKPNFTQFPFKTATKLCV